METPFVAFRDAWRHKPEFQKPLRGRRGGYLNLLMSYGQKKRLIHVLSWALFVICCLGADAQAFQDENANRSTSSPPRSRVTEKVKTRPRLTSPRANRAKPIKRTTISVVSLWIVSNPANCKLFIDGEPRGETNTNGELELKLPPATYSVRVSREGYITREADVDVLPTPEAQEVEFTLPTALVSLNVVTDPPGAEVYLTDVYKGTSGPNGLLVLERVSANQQHTIRVRKDGYVQQSTPVTSNTGQVSIKLLPDSMRLAVTTDPAEAEVYLNDVYQGTSTPDGSLVIAQVNPNQVHTVRAKKDGFRQQSLQLPPNSSQAMIKLLPDPIVLLVKDIRQRVAQNQLQEAYIGYDQLTNDSPDHPELSRLSESILLSLQARSNDMLRRVEPFGILLTLQDAQEITKLFEHARKSRPSDETIGIFAKYWEIKLLLLQSERAASAAEKETHLRNARGRLLEINENTLRNPYLLLEMGWGWWKLNERQNAEKKFLAARELKADWAYPHFGIGVLAMNMAENERAKSAKTMGYAQAIDNFGKAIRLKHDFATAYALQSISYSSLKRYEEAVASGLQAVAVDPQNAMAHFALGSAYFEKGKSGYRNALNELNQAISLGGSELSESIRGAIQIRLTRIRKTLKS